MALVKQNPEIFEWLMNNCSNYWPQTLFDEWFKPIFLTQYNFFDPEYFNKITTIVMRSETMLSFYGNLSFKKQRVWLTDLVNELQSTGNSDSRLIQELNQHPYAGQYLIFYLLDEGAILEGNDHMLEKALEETQDIDLIEWMEVEGIQDACSYFDANLKIQLRDKLVTQS